MYIIIMFLEYTTNHTHMKGEDTCTCTYYVLRVLMTYRSDEDFLFITIYSIVENIHAAKKTRKVIMLTNINS